MMTNNKEFEKLTYDHYSDFIKTTKKFLIKTGMQKLKVKVQNS